MAEQSNSTDLHGMGMGMGMGVGVGKVQVAYARGWVGMRGNVCSEMTILACVLPLVEAAAAAMVVAQVL